MPGLARKGSSRRDLPMCAEAGAPPRDRVQTKYGSRRGWPARIHVEISGVAAAARSDLRHVRDPGRTSRAAITWRTLSRCRARRRNVDDVPHEEARVDLDAVSRPRTPSRSRPNRALRPGAAFPPSIHLPADGTSGHEDPAHGFRRLPRGRRTLVSPLSHASTLEGREVASRTNAGYIVRNLGPGRVLTDPAALTRVREGTCPARAGRGALTALARDFTIAVRRRDYYWYSGRQQRVLPTIR